MANMLGDLLLSVRRPARYIGGEFGAYAKPWNKARLRWCLTFPDLYEIGMSNLGMAILYSILNETDWILADRAFAPARDMERLLISADKSLYGLESGRPLHEFDIVGISIPHELTYTNILSILKLGKIPLLARERRTGDPLVIGGGCGAFNPEPIAELFDAILIGDGEEAVVEISEAVLAAKDSNKGRREVLEALSAIEGVYLPHEGKARKVKKRTVKSIDPSTALRHPIVPNISLVHDRIAVEIQRGCTRGCRFCQAGMVYRPTRQAKPNEVVKAICTAISSGGFEECALLSLSAGDYTPIDSVIYNIDNKFRDMWVHISIPSVRVEAMSEEVVRSLSRSLKGGFTLAPEAATPYLRKVINKGNTEEDLLASVERIFEAGWRRIKLYFMIGLPSEKDEDIEAIGVLSRHILEIGRRFCRPEVVVNVSTFVPKPHTPFQWEAMINMEEIVRRRRILQNVINKKGLILKMHDPGMSVIEGVFARGGRELLPVVLKAHEMGARFDGWDDEFDLEIWRRALEASDISIERHLNKRKEEEELPWDHLFVDLDRKFLLMERDKAMRGEETHDCLRMGCVGCGVCRPPSIKPICADLDQKDHVREAGTEKRGGKVFRYRFAFKKSGDARFIGHLDLINILKRAMRRAGLPLRFTEGFNKRPRISISDPIAVGEEGTGWIEIELTAEVDVGTAIEDINRSLPPIGLKIYRWHEKEGSDVSRRS